MAKKKGRVVTKATERQQQLRELTREIKLAIRNSQMFLAEQSVALVKFRAEIDAYTKLLAVPLPSPVDIEVLRVRKRAKVRLGYLRRDVPGIESRFTLQQKMTADLEEMLAKLHG